MFHAAVAKALFVCKRARPDMKPADAALCTRVTAPKESNWNKLMRMLKFLNGTRDDALTLAADNLHVVKWHVDAAFAVHPDHKSPLEFPCLLERALRFRCPVRLLVISLSDTASCNLQQPRGAKTRQSLGQFWTADFVREENNEKPR